MRIQPEPTTAMVDCLLAILTVVWALFLFV